MSHEADDKKGTWEKDAAKWVRQADIPDNRFTRLVDCVAGLIARHVSGGRSRDIGCGPGLLCERLAAMGMDVHGADLAENMVAAAVARPEGSLPDAGSRFRLCADGEIPFADMKFDLITAIQMFPYIEQYREYIAKIKSLLKPGGLVVATNANRRSLWVAHELLGRFFRIPPHLHTIVNLWRTGYHSGGHVDYRRARQAHCARKFDRLWRQAGFEVIDGLDYYHIRRLDRDPLNRRGLSRILARHLAWHHAGVYRLPAGDRQAGAGAPRTPEDAAP